MEIQELLNEIPSWLIIVLAVVALWELVWKIIGMWTAARNNKLGWFLCIALLNTAGILPMTYWFLNRKSSKV